jgi:hypothetical protein
MAAVAAASTMAAMSTRTLHTFAHLAVLAGLCWAGMAVNSLVTEANEEGTTVVLSGAGDYIAYGLFAAALALTVPALVALHAHQQGADGRLGRVGALMACVGCSAQFVVIATIVVTGEEPSWFNTAAPLAILTWFAGSVLFGIGIRRARTLPGWVAIALPFVTLFAIVGSEAGTSLLIAAFLVVIGRRLARASSGAVEPALAAAGGRI